MSPTSVSQDAVFIGVNRYSDICDCRNGLVAFGAGKSVALWCSMDSSKGVFSTLNKHARNVTVTRFLPKTGQILSGSEDGQICLWSRDGQDCQPISYSLTSSVEQDADSVTTIAVSQRNIFVSGSSSGKLYVWKVSDRRLTLLLTFVVQTNFLPTTLAVQTIGNSYLLAVGGTSSNVFIYSFEAQVNDPVLCATLPGHEDWIKCFAFACEKPGLDYILASGSQDRYIRLWRLRLGEAVDSSYEDALKLQLLSNKKHKFSLQEGPAAFSFEALIMGHDDWVTGLSWHPFTSVDSTLAGAQKLQLLSLSADTALMIWEMDQDSGVWVSISRLGELSIKGASTATGSSGGFWSCNWFTDSLTQDQCILASGKTGAIRMYRSSDPENKNWDVVLGVTGPTSEVTDVVWSPEGTYFYATSLDQTTRLFAPWNNTEKQESTWHEFARPQIHGYDMVCLDILSTTKFVSGGEEKILRVFEMTNSIGSLLERFCGIGTDLTSEQLPKAASLPVLGLSNKADYGQLEAGEAQQREEDFENDALIEQDLTVDVLSTLTIPPLEDHLQRFTLFPELDKLYGHGYEITCCACSPDGALIASACRSNSTKHAVVRIFNACKNYQLVDTVLAGHSLTVTSMEFSHDGRYLLCVSRDRLFSLWRLREESEGLFDLVEMNPKAHSRIIWDSSWLPMGLQQFVTGSRDKCLKLWEVVAESVMLKGTLKTESPVTSVSVHEKLLEDSSSLLAVGGEDGKVCFYTVRPESEEIFFKMATVSQSYLPATRVNKLAFSSRVVDGKMHLAVGSSDSSLRVLSVEV